MKSAAFVFLGLLLGSCTIPGLFSHRRSFASFDRLKYYQLADSDAIVIEFFSIDSAVSPVGTKHSVSESNGTATLAFSIYYGPVGSAMNGIEIRDVGDYFTTINVGKIDKSKLQVSYRDENGLHPVPSAGILSEPFKPYVHGQLPPKS